jgi:RluA family pseudouridine synthase
MEFLKECKISDRHRNLRVDQFLARAFGYLSRSEWQREIERGKITYNGAVLVKYDRKTRPGDVIAYSGRDASEPEVNRDYSIIYEDENLLGINKPGNLPVHPAGVFYHNTLLTFLQERFGMKLHLLHRLDRETSGVLVLAKDPGVAARMHASFGTVRKVYLAMVHGVPEHDTFEVDIPIDFDAGSLLEHKRIAFAGARETARTGFERIISFGGYSLLKAMPVTGRQHQIRVHLKHAGFPIVGDKLYGTDERFYVEFVKKGPTEELAMQIGFPRSALHSRSIRFNHPVTMKEMYLKAPLPEDMKHFITTKRECHV